VGPYILVPVWGQAASCVWRACTGVCHGFGLNTIIVYLPCPAFLSACLCVREGESTELPKVVSTERLCTRERWAFEHSDFMADHGLRHRQPRHSSLHLRIPCFYIACSKGNGASDWHPPCWSSGQRAGAVTLQMAEWCRDSHNTPTSRKSRGSVHGDGQGQSQWPGHSRSRRHVLPPPTCTSSMVIPSSGCLRRTCAWYGLSRRI